MLATRRFLIVIGYSSLFFLLGIGVTVAVLHLFGFINSWAFPLKHVGVFLVLASIACLTLSKALKNTNLQRNRETPSQRPRPIASRRTVRFFWIVTLLFFALHGTFYLLSYYATHVRVPGQISIGIPKPSNVRTPSDRGLTYSTHQIDLGQSDWLEVWQISSQLPHSRGTVLLFPGNLGTKGSQLIGPAQSFSELGYDSLLVDFQGVGGSSGDTITIGLKEARDVEAALTYAQELNLSSPKILYGVSMGGAAIFRAISIHGIEPDAVIVELPFARLTEAIRSRLKYHNVPAFLTTELLVFWGGIQHGFNGFKHNPVDYAADVDCPTLVIHGEQDKWTTVEAIEALFQNLKGSKQLVLSSDAGHHQLIGVERPLWDASVRTFLNSL